MLKLVKSIRTTYLICKNLDKKLNEQIMGKLPIEILKPAPAWTYTAVDLFGPNNEQLKRHMELFSTASVQELST